MQQFHQLCTQRVLSLPTASHLPTLLKESNRRNRLALPNCLATAAPTSRHSLCGLSAVPFSSCAHSKSVTSLSSLSLSFYTCSSTWCSAPRSPGSFVHRFPSLPPPSTCRSFASPASATLAKRNREGDPTKISLVLKEVGKRVGVGLQGPGGKGRVLFSGLSLSFFHGAKVGILGVNGSGKSSLLKIIAGVDKEADGEVKVNHGFKIGYLSQEPQLNEQSTVAECIEKGVEHRLALIKEYEAITKQLETADDDTMEKLSERLGELTGQIEDSGSWELSDRISRAMSALRVPPSGAQVKNLSGGEKRRVALCALLLSEPDILLLDEPTNHLDAFSVSWLETFVSKYPGVVIAITHDRYFLDNMAGWILEIDAGGFYPFRGNYIAWLEAKEKRLEVDEKRDERLQKQIKKELEWKRRSASGGRSKDKARLARINKLEEEQEMKQANKRSEGGSLVIPVGLPLKGTPIDVKNLTYVLDDGRTLIRNLSFSVSDGDVLGIVGPNGTGKTTLLKLLVNEKKPTSGSITINESVRFGYNAQTREALLGDRTVWEEICQGEEDVEVSPGVVLPARAYVSQFNFKGTDQQKRIHQLSGGERNRVHLAKSLRQGCNVMLLDEPTNDLDVDTLRALEDAMGSWPGAAIVVSHDRWFLDRVCTRLLIFDNSKGEGNVIAFDGNFSEYEKTIATDKESE